MALGLEGVILAIIIGTLAAIVYSLRILVLLEKRISRIDFHIEKLVKSILKEETTIEGDERKIEKALKIK
ncbi:hypothetical protein COV19_00620 [Candidatus Woesearchaeota archaeon CG10_big_fil_rev_8_21_14_0_10_44_13]|nr:MAG: hypothetical protein COV19_00620 [Candidatus Woesearchaeota archaeon CG10_big_fil_rev_8_21_14_0_10_44_13]